MAPILKRTTWSTPRTLCFLWVLYYLKDMHLQVPNENRILYTTFHRFTNRAYNHCNNRLVHASGRNSLCNDWKQYHRRRKQELNRIYKVNKVPWGLPMSLLASFVTFACYLWMVLFLCKYSVLAVLLSTNRNLDLWREYGGGFHIQSTRSFRNTTETKKGLHEET